MQSSNLRTGEAFSVAIMMSTYNGEEFLKKQIDSILSQANVSINLLIRDDGSSDHTVDILSEYESKHSNITVVKGNNLGYANSFLTLVDMVGDSDFYAFSDQDDIWEEDKLSAAVERIKNKPYTVYASNLKMVDEDENPLGTKRFDGFMATVGGVFSRNRLAGCTMVFGKELMNRVSSDAKEIISFNSFNYGHDGWMLLYTLSLGGNVIVDEESHILYRRHNSAVSSSHGGLKKRICTELRIFWNKEDRRRKTARFLIDHIGFDLNPSAKNVLYNISDYRDNPWKRVRLLFSNELNTNIVLVDLKTKLAVFLGRY